MFSLHLVKLKLKRFQHWSQKVIKWHFILFPDRVLLQIILFCCFQGWAYWNHSSFSIEETLMLGSFKWPQREKSISIKGASWMALQCFENQRIEAESQEFSNYTGNTTRDVLFANNEQSGHNPLNYIVNCNWPPHHVLVLQQKWLFTC